MAATAISEHNYGDLIVRDLPNLARLAPGRKPAWSHRGEDLSVNLISCMSREGVGAHVNEEVEVLIVGVDGDGSVEVDGHWHTLGSGQLVVIPKGARRATRCDGDRFIYLTCHRSRSGLWPAVLGHGDNIIEVGRS